MTGRPQRRAALGLVTKKAKTPAFDASMPGRSSDRFPHAISVNELSASHRKIVARAYKNRARYLRDRKDPARCSRADFMAGYLAFAVENGLGWALLDVEERTAG
jgi:hypothetical protein